MLLKMRFVQRDCKTAFFFLRDRDGKYRKKKQFFAFMEIKFKNFLKPFDTFLMLQCFDLALKAPSGINGVAASLKRV